MSTERAMEAKWLSAGTQGPGTWAPYGSRKRDGSSVRRIFLFCTCSRCPSTELLLSLYDLQQPTPGTSPTKSAASSKSACTTEFQSSLTSGFRPPLASVVKPSMQRGVPVTPRSGDRQAEAEDDCEEYTPFPPAPRSIFESNSSLIGPRIPYKVVAASDLMCSCQHSSQVFVASVLTTRRVTCKMVDGTGRCCEC